MKIKVEYTPNGFEDQLVSCEVADKDVLTVDDALELFAKALVGVGYAHYEFEIRNVPEVK